MFHETRLSVSLFGIPRIWTACHGILTACHGILTACHGILTACHGMLTACHGILTACHGILTACHGILTACHGSRVPVIMKSVDRGSTYMSLMYATGWETSGWKTSALPLCWPRDRFVMENGSRIKLCYLNCVMHPASSIPHATQHFAFRGAYDTF
jgi:hypothetical protein